MHTAPSTDKSGISALPSCRFRGHASSAADMPFAVLRTFLGAPRSACPALYDNPRRNFSLLGQTRSAPAPRGTPTAQPQQEPALQRAEFCPRSVLRSREISEVLFSRREHPGPAVSFPLPCICSVRLLNPRQTRCSLCERFLSVSSRVAPARSRPFANTSPTLDVAPREYSQVSTPLRA